MNIITIENTNETLCSINPLYTKSMNMQEKNRELLITLDDVWNEQDWD